MTVVPICLQAAPTGSNLKTAFGTSTNFSMGLEVICWGVRLCLMQTLLGLAQAGRRPYTFGLVQWKEFGGVLMYGSRSLSHQLGAPPEGCTWLWPVVGVQGIPCGD